MKIQRCMRNKEDLFFIIAIMFLCAILPIITILLYIRYNSAPIEQKIERSIITKPLLTLIDSTLHESEKNNRYSAVINAKTTTIFKNVSYITCNITTCSLFEGSEFKGNILSPTAIINKDSKIVTFPTTVCGSYDQIKFEGTDAHLSFSDFILSSSKPLFVSSKNIQHSGAQYHLDLKNYNGCMEGGVRTEFTQLGNQQPL